MKFKFNFATKFAALAVFVSANLISTFSFAAVVTIEGLVDKVVPEKTEIYVLADGKRHEFYFTDKTELTQAGQKVAFTVLKKSQKVKVTADKVGKRLDPLKVEVLE
jgi:hypothetical protein